MRRGSLLWFNMRIFLSSGGFWSHWGWFGVFLGLLEATPLNPKASPSRAAAPPPRPRRELQTLSFYELTRHFLADEDEMQNILHHELSKAHRLPADGVFTANYSRPRKQMSRFLLAQRKWNTECPRSSRTVHRLVPLTLGSAAEHLLGVYPQRTQYPLIKEYTLNDRGLNIMILGIFLN